MFIKKNEKKGFTILSVLLALVIILILVGNYLGPEKKGEKNWAQTNIEKSENTACLANRTQLVTQISMYVVNHPGEPLTIDKMQAANYSVPLCPDGGVYSIGKNNEVYCSKHYPDPSKPVVTPSTGAAQFPPSQAGQSSQRLPNQIISDTMKAQSEQTGR